MRRYGQNKILQKIENIPSRVRGNIAEIEKTVLIVQFPIEPVQNIGLLIHWTSFDAIALT